MKTSTGEKMIKDLNLMDEWSRFRDQYQTPDRVTHPGRFDLPNRETGKVDIFTGKEWVLLGFDRGRRARAFRIKRIHLSTWRMHSHHFGRLRRWIRRRENGKGGETIFDWFGDFLHTASNQNQ